MTGGLGGLFSTTGGVRGPCGSAVRSRGAFVMILAALAILPGAGSDKLPTRPGGTPAPQAPPAVDPRVAARESATEHNNLGIALLAQFKPADGEKEFRQALDSGYEYFQGFFFVRPGIVAGRAIPASKLNILNLIREAHRPDVRHARVEDIIKHEVSLALKLLTHVRAAAWGLRRPVDSVQDAMLLLGDQALRKWASVIAVAALGSDHPSELLVASVARASFCDGLLIEMGRADLAQDAFFLGLFSMIDAFLGRPLSEAVERLPLSARGRARVARVARTAALLAGAEAVAPEHVAEALSYRSPAELGTP